MECKTYLHVNLGRHDATLDNMESRLNCCSEEGRRSAGHDCYDTRSWSLSMSCALFQYHHDLSTTRHGEEVSLQNKHAHCKIDQMSRTATSHATSAERLADYACRTDSFRYGTANITFRYLRVHLCLLCSWPWKHTRCWHTVHVNPTESSLRRMLPTLASLLINKLTLSERICAASNIDGQRDMRRRR